MGPYHLKYTSPEGSVFFQFRYSSTNHCFIGLVLREDKSGNVSQSSHNYDEKFVDEALGQLARIEEAEFNRERNKFLADTYENFHRKFYDMWADYLRAKNLSYQAVHQKKFIIERDKEFETQFHLNGVYTKRKSLEQTQNEVYLQNNPSLTDIFDQARNDALLDNAAGRI